MVHDHDEAWQCLSAAEREIVLARGDDSPKIPTTPGVDRYHEIEAQLEAVYFEQLRPGELTKIRNALSELRAWLDGQ